MPEHPTPDLPLSDQPGVPPALPLISGGGHLPLGQPPGHPRRPGSAAGLRGLSPDPAGVPRPRRLGELCPEERRENACALRTSAGLLSAYTLPTGVTPWAITEADRSTTTLLLPGEY